MLKTIANAWKVPDLRKKMLFTIFIVFIFRFGSAIPVPFLDVDALRKLTSSWNETNNMLSYFDMFSGGAFSNATLFAMSVTPYINSSIIMQLLSVAIPALERLSKEGTEGRKKIGTITRYVTVALGIIQGTAYYIYLLRSQVRAEDGSVHNIVQYQGWNLSGIFSAITIIMVFTAGTALMMWLGEQINQNGLGNGISILLFVGIIARLPVTMLVLWCIAFGLIILILLLGIVAVLQSGVSMDNYGTIVLFVTFAVSILALVLGIKYYSIQSRNLKNIRYCITNEANPRRFSIFPSVILILGVVLSIIGIIGMQGVMGSTKLKNLVSDYLLEYFRESGISKIDKDLPRQFTETIINSVWSTKAQVMSIISSVLGIIEMLSTAVIYISAKSKLNDFTEL